MTLTISEPAEAKSVKCKKGFVEVCDAPLDMVDVAWHAWVILINMIICIMMINLIYLNYMNMKVLTQSRGALAV